MPRTLPGSKTQHIAESISYMKTFAEVEYLQEKVSAATEAVATVTRYEIEGVRGRVVWLSLSSSCNYTSHETV